MGILRCRCRRGAVLGGTSSHASHRLGRPSRRLGRSRRKQHHADGHRHRHEHQPPYAHYRVVVAMTTRWLRSATRSVTGPGSTVEIAGAARFARGHVRFSLPTCQRRRKDCPKRSSPPPRFRPTCHRRRTQRHPQTTAHRPAIGGAHSGHRQHCTVRQPQRASHRDGAAGGLAQVRRRPGVPWRSRPVWRSWKRRRLVIVRSWVRVPPPALWTTRTFMRCRVHGQSSACP